MKSTLETLSPTRVKLDIEVPFEELDPSIKKAYRSINQQISLPGFRKGKVPNKLIDKHVGRSAVLEEAINDAIPAQLQAAFDEHTLKVMSRPDVSPKEIEDGKHFVFTTEVDVRPTIEIPDLSEVEISVEATDVAEKDIDEELKQLADRFGSLKDVERPAVDGDYLSMDINVTVDGEEIPGGSATNLSYEVGGGDLLDGVDEAVRGVEAGETRNFTSTLVAGEYADKEAEVEVTVHSVKEKELPELNDEFAMLASEFDTIDELREDLKQTIEKRHLREQAVAARDKALETLLERVEIPLPEQALESEISFRRGQLQEAVQGMGSTMEAYLRAQGQNSEEFEKKLRDDATEAVRAQILLDTIADSHELTVEQQELSSEIVRRATESRVDPQQYADYLVENNQLMLIGADLRRGKALSVALEEMPVKDTEGNVVDLEAIRKELTVE